MPGYRDKCWVWCRVCRAFCSRCLAQLSGKISHLCLLPFALSLTGFVKIWFISKCTFHKKFKFCLFCRRKWFKSGQQAIWLLGKGVTTSKNGQATLKGHLGGKGAAKLTYPKSVFPLAFRAFYFEKGKNKNRKVLRMFWKKSKFRPHSAQVNSSDAQCDTGGPTVIPTVIFSLVHLPPSKSWVA